MSQLITVDRTTLEKALKRAFNLGQTYWQQAVHDAPDAIDAAIAKGAK